MLINDCFVLLNVSQHDVFITHLAGSGSMFGLDTILKLTEQSIFMSRTALRLEFDLFRLELFQYTVPLKALKL